jgi:acetyl esterase/lipase
VTSDPTRRAQRVSYGDDASQFGELSVPSGSAPRGVVVVIHGGFWKAAYDLSLGRVLATSLVAHGWAAWNVEYRRVGNGGGVPQTLDDVAAAIDTLADHDVPLDRVIALGHSAGGHLATWAASRGRHDRWAASVELTAVVSQAGVLDLRSAHDERLGAGAVEGESVDPIRQIPLDVPVHCVHGLADDTVPVSQSRAYVAAATAAGARSELTEVEGGHDTVIDPSADAWRRTLEILGDL